MNILYDHLAFMEKYGGVSRYYCNMIKNLDSDINYELSVKFSSNEYLSEIAKSKYFHMINKSFNHKERLYSELNKFNSINQIKKGNYDIYHMTHCDPYGFKYVPHNKLKVMTVHDLNLVILKGICKDNFSLKVWQRQSVDLVDSIITVSENTKKDMIEQWNIPPEKITVIYHGIPLINLEQIQKIQLIKYPYILYVGARSKFKNFDNTIKAFSTILKKYPKLKFVCTGSDFTKTEIDFFKSLNINESIIHINATDLELYALYNHAICYIYPSLYEGFGIPLLEAMSCECPVICSNSSCFPEIAGNAALYFDPLSQNDISNQIIKILENDSIKKDLILKGKENCKRFSWEKCGKEHSSFYKSLL